MKIYNFCLLFPYDRKMVLKCIHGLVQLHYGSYNDLIQLTMPELTDIQKVVTSIQQQEELNKAGLK